MQRTSRLVLKITEPVRSITGKLSRPYGNIHFITVTEIWAHASLCDSVLAVSCYNLFLEDVLLSEGMTSRFMSVPLALL